VVVLLAEPYYVVGQAYLHVKFRAAADTGYVVANCLTQCLAVTLWPSQAVFFSSLAVLANSVLFVLAHAIYFSRVIKKSRKDDDEIPFDSVVDFMPSFSPGFFEVDGERFSLAASFFKQGFLKQALTEGEKYMFTWFNLMTLAEQGIYDVVANLGSIPARLLFVKLEESARLYFGLSVRRGPNADMKKEVDASKHLWILLKSLVLIGLVVCAFGVSYCHALLHLYGGHLLSAGTGPALLRAHCFYVMFLAVNGVTECYAFCVMTQEELAAYNYKYGLMTAIFLASTWLLAKAAGPMGFTLANMCNFSMRIAHNVGVIEERHLRSEVKPLRDLMPSWATIGSLILAGLACQASEMAFDDSSMLGIVKHVAFGGMIFLTVMCVIWKNETFLKHFIPARKEKKVD